MVSVLTIISIIFSMIFSVACLLVPAIIFWKKYKTSWKAFGLGCLVWFLFAGVLEQILHAIVLGSPIGASIQNSTVLMAIYGGLAAGLFEETGRFVVMKFLLKKQYDNSRNALMYGAGHGGFEAFFLLGSGMLNNLIYSIMINAGLKEELISALPEEGRASMLAVFQNLINSKPFDFLMGDFERISAIILHIALSVLVWIAVTKKKTYFFPIAILVHALVDGLMVIVAGTGLPIPVVELVIFAMAVCTAFIVFIVYKKEYRPTDK